MPDGGSSAARGAGRPDRPRPRRRRASRDPRSEPSRDRTESVVIVKEDLLADLKPQVRRREPDLPVRSEEAEFGPGLHEEWQAAHEAERTAATYDTWLAGEITQAAVAWVLGTVF